MASYTTHTATFEAAPLGLVLGKSEEDGSAVIVSVAARADGR